MRHVNQTRQGASPYVGERFRSSVGVVEFRTMTNSNKEWYPNCKMCVMECPEACGFVECFFSLSKEGDSAMTPCFGYYVKIEEEEK